MCNAKLFQGEVLCITIVSRCFTRCSWDTRTQQMKFYQDFLCHGCPVQLGNSFSSSSCVSTDLGPSAIRFRDHKEKRGIPSGGGDLADAPLSAWSPLQWGRSNLVKPKESPKPGLLNSGFERIMSGFFSEIKRRNAEFTKLPLVQTPQLLI